MTRTPSQPASTEPASEETLGGAPTLRMIDDDVDGAVCGADGCMPPGSINVRCAPAKG